MATTIIEETDDFQVVRRTSPAGFTDTVEWKAGREPVEQVNERNIRDAARQALATNRTYAQRATPTAAQTTAQVKALSQQQNGIIRLLLNLLDGTD